MNNAARKRLRKTEKKNRVKMSKFWYFIIIWGLTSTGQLAFSQTNYTTANNGTWNVAGTWDANGVPPNPLPNGDSIIIKHIINYNVSMEVLGVMLVQSGATIIGDGGSDLDIGKGGIAIGQLINYGNITVQNLEVKPDNGCTANNDFPSIHNYKVITTTNKLHIGNNCGAGAFYNYSEAVVSVANDIHLDNYLYNVSTMSAAVKLKNHGGTVEGCGTIETPLLDIDINTGRPGLFGCIDICNAGADPTINIDGADYTNLNDAFTNGPAAEVTIDDDSTFICGFNQAGDVNSLPIELLYFRAKLQHNQTVDLSWSTLSETNNDFFTIERSQDAVQWQITATVKGAGNSKSTLFYNFTDSAPLSGVSYYRLKQTDFDGTFAYSKIVSVYVENDKVISLHLHPNPSSGIFHVNVHTITNPILISVTDLLGKPVYTKTLNNVDKLLDMSHLPKGTYLATIKAKGLIMREKIIIK